MKNYRKALLTFFLKPFSKNVQWHCSECFCFVYFCYYNSLHFLHFYLKIITCKQSETTFKIIVLSTEKPSKRLPRIYDQVLGSYDGKPTTGLFLCLLFCLQKK